MFKNKQFLGCNYSLVSITLATLLLTTLFTQMLIMPKTTFAAACDPNRCYEGRITNQLNFGSTAKIITPNVGWINSGSDVLLSWILINSQTPWWLGPQAFIQSGPFQGVNFPWINCGGINPKVFWEYIDFSGPGPNHPYDNGCVDYYPASGTSHIYGQEYDTANGGYWCFVYDGICYKSAPAATGNPIFPGIRPTGFTSTQQVAAYGETNDTRIQMGGFGWLGRVSLSRIEYKPNSNGAFSAFTLPPIGPGVYGTCNIVGGTSCEYQHHSDGNAADGNRWFVEVWTNRLY